MNETVGLWREGRGVRCGDGMQGGRVVGGGFAGAEPVKSFGS